MSGKIFRRRSEWLTNVIQQKKRRSDNTEFYIECRNKKIRFSNARQRINIMTSSSSVHFKMWIVHLHTEKRKFRWKSKVMNKFFFFLLRPGILRFAANNLEQAKLYYVVHQQRLITVFFDLGILDVIFPSFVVELIHLDHLIRIELELWYAQLCSQMETEKQTTKTKDRTKKKQI